jgi:predicted nucleotidyltransferase
MEPLQDRTAGIPALAALTTFADRAAVALHADDRVRALWLTGSLAAGTADPQSDVDLRVRICPPIAGLTGIRSNSCLLRMQ